jgi:hypothetical protein
MREDIQLTQKSIVVSRHGLPAMLGLAIPLLLALILGFFRLGVGEQHVDVYQVQDVFKQSWVDLIRDFFTPDGLYGGFQAPVYFLLAKAYGELFGNSNTQLALVSVVALGLLVGLSWYAYPLLTESNNRRVRFIFTLLVAASPVHIWWAQTAKYTLWFELTCVLSLVAGLQFIQKQNNRSAVLFALSIVLVIYTHYFGLIFAVAQFGILGGLALYRRDRQWLYRTSGAGAMAGALIAPLLPVVFQATQLREAEQYHFVDATISASSIVRGVIVEWVFGYGLLSGGENLSGLAHAYADLTAGNIQAALGPLFQVSVVLCAGLILFAALTYTAIQIFRRRAASVQAIYLSAVLLTTFILAQIVHFSFRFSYLGVGTWCILACCAIGWSSARRAYAPALFVTVMLVLYSISLNVYYRNMHYRYPGMGLVVDYLDAHQSDVQSAVIDKWIVDVRGTDHEYRLPQSVSIYQVDSPSAIEPSNLVGHSTVAFLAGRWKQVRQNLDAMKSENPSFSWVLVETWPSLEASDRSIHVVRLDTIASQPFQ